MISLCTLALQQFLYTQLHFQLSHILRGWSEFIFSKQNAVDLLLTGHIMKTHTLTPKKLQQNVSQRFVGLLGVLDDSKNVYQNLSLHSGLKVGHSKMASPSHKAAAIFSILVRDLSVTSRDQSKCDISHWRSYLVLNFCPRTQNIAPC